MTRRRALFLALALTVSVFLTACGTDGTTADKASPETTNTATEEARIKVPEERPAYMGKVKEIIGNEVSIYKAEIPEKTTQGTPTQGDNAQAQGQSGSPAQATNSAQANGEQRQANRGFSMNFSETAETLLIPVGTPIVSMQRGGTGATEVALTAIKADSLLRIWEKDGAITFVQVMSAGGQRSMPQNTNGNNQNRGGGGAGFMGGPPPGM